MSYIVGVDDHGDPQTKQKHTNKLMSNSAITLVALVITIIVLLILAGVALAMMVGPSGIFTKAKNAKEEMQYAQELEALKLAVLDAKMENLDASFEELIEVLKNDPKYTYVINNTKQLSDISDNGGIKAFGDITGNTIYVIPEKYEFGIDSELNIIEPENRVASSNNSQSSDEEQTEGEDRIVKTLKEKEQYRIEAGEHDGHEIVQAADLASQTPGDATAADIAKNKKAWVNGKEVEGTASSQKEGQYSLTGGLNGFTAVDGETNITSLGIEPKSFEENTIDTEDYPNYRWHSSVEKVLDKTITLSGKFEFSSNIYMFNNSNGYVGRFKVRLYSKENDGTYKKVAQIMIADGWNSLSKVTYSAMINNSTMAQNPGTGGSTAWACQNLSGRWAIVGDGSNMHLYLGGHKLLSGTYTNELKVDKIEILFQEGSNHNLFPVSVEDVYIGEPYYYKDII